MEAVAKLKNYPTSPRKMRLLADMVKGKKVDEALNILRFAPTPNAEILSKTIKSAMANAENNFQMIPTELKIVKVTADEARMLKRFKARARGRANQILKRSSHITVVVSD